MAKSPLAKWDILRDNQTLRELLRRRMVDQGLTMAALARAVDIPYTHVKQYFAGGYKWKGINQYNLIKIANHLGVEVTLDIKLKF